MATAGIKVGDVFFANTTFEFGRARSVSETKYVKGESVVQVSDSYTSKYLTNIVAGYDPKTGKANYELSDKFDRSSKQRVGKEFVVESVTWTGGSDREGIANEPHVVARRLAKDGTYDPKGELITFVYATVGCRSNFNTAARVTAHRKMKRTVSFV